jgi:hypothetical protein
MAKWSSRSKFFRVNIYHTPKGRGQITIPKPLLDAFDRPDSIIFYLEQDYIKVKFGHSQDLPKQVDSVAQENDATETN